ncbi:MAG: DUF302 domain-containing protein [Nitrospira defluvii]|nr:DUF302 domain-containing protein [Nitrospira defluvii]
MRRLDRVMVGAFCGIAWLSIVVATASADSTVITKRSHYSVHETIDRIEKVLFEKGMKIFARIDHSGEAKKVGLDMRSTELLIFGNPKGGTALMIAKPTAAIDLPMKALAWEDSNGQVWLTYNAPELLYERHAVPKELVERLDPVGPFLERAVE